MEYDKGVLVVVVNGPFKDVEGLILVLKSDGLEPERYARIGTFKAKPENSLWVEQEGVVVRDIVII